MTYQSRLSSVSATTASESSTINATAASVLGFLSIGPLTGWDMNELAQVSVGHFWNITRSQIYRELATLTDFGLVDHDGDGPRNTRRYRLTEEGRTRLHGWLTEPPGEPIERIPFLVKLFFASELTAKERRSLLTAARAQTEASLKTLQEALPMAEQLSPQAAATARYGIAVKQAILDWFDAETASA